MSINIFVSEFLKPYDVNGKMTQKWESDINQRKLKKVLKIMAKDPDKPKRGKSGFLFFCEEKRPIIKESNRDMKVKEVVQVLGVMWRKLKLDGNTKQYDDLSLDDRERYKNDMEEYNKKIKNEKSLKSKKTVITTVIKEKVTTTAVENFMKSKKKKVQEKRNDLNEIQIEKLLRDKWKKLPVAKRMKYINKDA